MKSMLVCHLSIFVWSNTPKLKKHEQSKVKEMITNKHFLPQCTHKRTHTLISANIEWLNPMVRDSHKFFRFHRKKNVNRD